MKEFTSNIKIVCLTPFQSHAEPQAIVLLVYLHVFSLKNISIKALAKAFCVLNHYAYFSLYPALPKKKFTMVTTKIPKLQQFFLNI